MFSLIPRFSVYKNKEGNVIIIECAEDCQCPENELFY